MTIVLGGRTSSARPLRVAVLGGGKQARHVIAGVADDAAVNVVAMVTRSPAADVLDFADRYDVEWVPSVSDLLAREPDVVVEAATVAACQEHLPSVLDDGVDAIILSVAALVDPAVERSVLSAASRSGARVLIPSGPAVGLDVLELLRGRELADVELDVRVPVDPLPGVPEYDGSGRPQEIFRGTAREAGRRFPRILNHAMAIALASCGLDATRLRVVIDPEVAVFRCTTTATATSVTIRTVVELTPAYHTSAGGNITSHSVLEALTRMAAERRRTRPG